MKLRYSHALCCTLLWPAIGAAQPPSFLLEWGQYPQLQGPFGIAVSATNDVYVTDQIDIGVKQFTANGGFVRRWGARGTTNGLFSGLVGVAVDAAGSVYVTDEGNHRVQKFTASGTYVSQFGNVAGSGLLGSPSSIAVNGSGNVFVTDAENERIMKYTSNGVFITGFGSRGLGDGRQRVEKFGWLPTPVRTSTWGRVKRLFR